MELLRKICSGCNQEKYGAEFHRDKHAKDGLRYKCKSCVKIIDDSKKDIRNQRAREIYAANPSAKIAKTRSYALEHPEWYKRALRKSHEKHRVARYARIKDRLKNDSEFVSKCKEATRRSEHRRRAMKQSTGVELLTRQDYSTLLFEYQNSCYICGTYISYELNNLHFDHYQPLSKGGEHKLSNLRPSCADCNIRKSATWPVTEDFLTRIKEDVQNNRLSSYQDGAEVIAHVH